MFNSRFSSRGIAALVAAPLIALAVSSPARALPTPAAIFEKDIPESVEDLRALQDKVREVLKKVIPATVNVRIGSSQGSGVIIKDRYILTAGHVSGKPGRKVVITMHDGSRIKGETLGWNKGIDSGLIKITDDGDFPYVDIGKSEDMPRGKWVIATGHPGGYRPGRAPVVRVGRVVSNESRAVRSDCSLVGGDSGGPLFDLDGNVVGIHSRIGGSITANHHVPVDTYTDTWDRLAKGEEWGGRFGGRSGPSGEKRAYYGIQFDPDSEKLKILQVLEEGPAAKGGLEAGDEVLQFEGKAVDTLVELRELIREKKPGDKVTFKVQRGDAVLSLRVTVGSRSD